MSRAHKIRRGAHRGPVVRDHAGPRRTTDPELAESHIYLMPSVAEVVKAGYEADYHARLFNERNEFIRRFNADPAFRAEAKQRTVDNMAREAEEAARGRASGRVHD